MKLAWLFVAAIAAFSNGPAAAGQPVYVGIYEPEHIDPAAGATSYDPATKQYAYHNGKSHIRVAFTYSDGQWLALPHDDALLAKPPQGLEAFPPALSFHDLSSAPFAIDAHRGDWSFYADVGVYRPTTPMPTALLKATKGMGDWGGDYRYAPVILTTASGSARGVPAVTLGDDGMASMLAAMRGQVPTYTICDQPEHKIRDQAWQAKDIRVLKALRGPAGTLVELELNDKLDQCQFYDEGYPDKQGVIHCDYCSHWFVLAPDGKVRPLGNAMDFLGAADLAGDGRVEWVFSQHAEGHDSYILFADDFARRVDFTWSYH